MNSAPHSRNQGKTWQWMLFSQVKDKFHEGCAAVFFATKMAKIIRFLRAYKRGIAISLLLAYATFVLIHPDEEGRISDLIWFAVLVMFIASQLFWIRRVVDVGERFLPGKPSRALLGAIAGAI